MIHWKFFDYIGAWTAHVMSEQYLTEDRQGPMSFFYVELLRQKERRMVHLVLYAKKNSSFFPEAATS